MRALSAVWKRIALLFVIATCVRSQTVQCGFGTCGAGLACDEVNRECVDPARLVDCVGMPDATRCNIVGEPIGLCKGDICIRERCGDGLVSGEEVCDGADDVPAVGTCVDFAYDYGTLACTAICSEAIGACRRLGWAFRTIPGSSGEVRAIAEDGDNLYVAVLGALFRFDGSSWSGPDMGTQGVELEALWAVGGHVFAVGYVGSFGQGTGALLHYDGTSWSRMNVPNEMRALWARSATDAYAVGDEGAIYHFDGGTWTAMSSPTTMGLLAVWGTDGRVVAVGDAGTLLHDTGAGWNAVDISAFTQGQLRGVWGSDASDFYVIEHGGEIFRFDGAAFSLVHTTGGNPPVTLEAISGRSASEIYVVGLDGTILRGDGSSWQTMESPASAYLQAVHVGADTVYAAGTADQFLTYEGVAWVTPQLTEPAGTIYSLRAPDPDTLVAAGNGCRLYEHDGTTWAEQIAQNCGDGCQSSLFGLWGTSATHAYAVGADATLLERTSTGWECRTAPFDTSNWIFAVWGSSSSDVFIGGGAPEANTPALGHFNGTSWEDWSSRVPFLGIIRGIWGTGPTNVFLVSQNGRIAHYNGTSFVEMDSPPMFPGLKSVWGSGPSDVFVVGDLGKILHYDGASWTEMHVPIGLTVPTDAGMSAVVGSGPDNVFAAGGRTLLHYDGMRWAPVNRPTSSAAEALYLAGDQLFVVGAHGIGPRLTGQLRR